MQEENGGFWVKGKEKFILGAGDEFWANPRNFNILGFFGSFTFKFVEATWARVVPAG